MNPQGPEAQRSDTERPQPTGAVAAQPRVRLPLLGGFLAAAGVYFSSDAAAPLPSLAGAALFLVLAVESDLRQRRIPNLYTGCGLVLALAFAGIGGGFPALGTALLGATIGLAVLFPVFAMGGMGAGDVKAAMVLGACFGPAPLASVLWWSVLAAGTIAVIWVALRGEALDFGRRWVGNALTSAQTGQAFYTPPQPGSAAASGLPFAVALALGVCSHQLWGAPWA